MYVRYVSHFPTIEVSHLHISVAGGVLDKTWIVCDNTPTSPFFGHCYAQWDSPNASDLLQMSTSANGGASWNSAVVISSEKTVYFMMM